jgi:hypothetical protein
MLGGPSDSAPPSRAQYELVGTLALCPPYGLRIHTLEQTSFPRLFCVTAASASEVRDGRSSFVGWAKERSDVPTIYPRSSRKMVGTLALCPPYALPADLLAAQAQIPCRVCDKSTRRQITSDFPKSRQALHAKIFRFRICPNQPHNSARLTR